MDVHVFCSCFLFMIFPSKGRSWSQSGNRLWDLIRLDYNQTSSIFCHHDIPWHTMTYHDSVRFWRSLQEVRIRSLKDDWNGKHWNTKRNRARNDETMRRRDDETDTRRQAQHEDKLKPLASAQRLRRELCKHVQTMRSMWRSKRRVCEKRRFHCAFHCAFHCVFYWERSKGPKGDKFD